MAARATALTALALVIGACTPVQWQHASLGSTPSADELSYCDQSAFYEAHRQAFLDDFMRPRFFFGRDGRFHPARFGYGYPYRDRFFMERQLFDYCMRAKGYQLTPVRPADRSG